MAPKRKCDSRYIKYGFIEIKVGVCTDFRIVGNLVMLGFY